MSTIAEHIIALLLEDRIQDFIERHPEAKLKRPKLIQWMEYDPSNTKKYFNWMVREFVRGNTKWTNRQLDHARDDFKEFERLLTLPAFQGNRDIMQYDFKTFSDTVTQNRTLVSRSAEQRQRREKEKAKWQPKQGQAGVKLVAEAGNIQVIQITNADSLSYWAWQAYSANNPNWKYPPNTSDMSAEQIEALPPWNTSDAYGPWCVRGTSFGNNYLNSEPDKAFYMVLKDGGPYVGILLHGGQAKDLENNAINLGMAEEIYPAMRQVLDAAAEAGNDYTGECSIFMNLRFLTGEAKDGETVTGPRNSLDLSHSSLAKLPARLTVNGELDLTGCPITEIPPELTVTGRLKIAGTGITKLPLDLKIKSMEWSEPLTWEEVKKMFYRMRGGDMKQHYIVQAGLAGATEEEQSQAWINFQPRLINYFLVDPKIDKAVRGQLVYVKHPQKAVSQ
jgi:hypothetical protein